MPVVNDHNRRGDAPQLDGIGGRCARSGSGTAIGKVIAGRERPRRKWWPAVEPNTGEDAHSGRHRRGDAPWKRHRRGDAHSGRHRRGDARSEGDARRERHRRGDAHSGPAIGEVMPAVDR
uniref:LigA n=1 Tax=Haemonchus contortus TaxID=6289 RepID=A0A7I4Y157_HAECO